MKKETFIAKSKLFHGDKYDYSKVLDIFSVRDKVCIICPVHGEFYLRADTHSLGAGCPKCGHERTGRLCRKLNLDNTTSNILNIDFPIIDNPKIPEKQYIIGTIYLFINKINHKVYVGQTYNKYTERWTAHRNANDTFYFHKALRKYGWDNFNKYILELTESYIINSDNINTVNNWLNEREKYYILLFSSNIPDKGYNSTSGGKDNYPEFILIINKSNKQYGKKVELYDLNGNLVKIWNSVKEIYTTTEFKNDGISLCSKGLRESYKGYKWKIIDHELKNTVCTSITASKPVLLYDINGNFIQEFESGSEVKKILGIDDHLVRGCCNKVYNTSKGYIWIFKSDEVLSKLPLEELESRNLDKRVLLKSLNGDFIKVWNNSSEAGKALNLNPTCIAKCARGDSKSSLGFIWENITLRELIDNKIIEY